MENTTNKSKTTTTENQIMQKEFQGTQTPEVMLKTILNELRRCNKMYEGVTYDYTTQNQIAPGSFLEAVPNKESSLLQAICKQFKDHVELQPNTPHYIDILQLGNRRKNDAFQLKMIDSICEIANSARSKVIIRYLEGNPNDGNNDQNYNFFEELKNRFRKSNSNVFFYAANLDYSWTDLANNPGSWNHAKIFAIDGVVSIVGGQNYWDDYLGSHNKNLYDLSYLTYGRATNSAHQYADFLWKYIANPGGDKATSHKSWHMGANSSSNELPPQYNAKDYPQYNLRSHLPILAVGNLGLWDNQSKIVAAEALTATHIKVKNTYPSLEKAVNIALSYPFHLWYYDTPKAMQASIASRNLALRMVAKNGRIRIIQQKIANTDISKDHKILGNDYVIWPGELLDTLTRTIIEKNAYVDIIVSHHNSNYYGGYSDDMGGKALRGVLIDRLALKLNSVEKAEALANRYLKIKQMPYNRYNHSKVWIVDDKLFYIGSDNVYPGFLQEYGYITGDIDSCQKFIATYWNKMWELSELV